MGAGAGGTACSSLEQLAKRVTVIQRNPAMTAWKTFVFLLKETMRCSAPERLIRLVIPGQLGSTTYPWIKTLNNA